MQKVQCTFEITVPTLGYLQGNPGQDARYHKASQFVYMLTSGQIKEGTKLEIPLWLAEMLAVSQTSTNSTNVTLDLPDSLSHKVLNALKADARTVELRALAPHFYALGTRILELFEDEELSDVLSEVHVALLVF